MSEDLKPPILLLYRELQDEAAVALGRAFINDPTFQAIVPHIGDPGVRAKALRELFHAMFVVERRMGQPTFGMIQDGKVIAAAVTEGAAAPSTFDTVMAGIGQMPRLIRAIGFDGIRRAMTIFRVLAASNPRERHIYLQASGVDPDYQRRHLGGALLEYLRGQARVRQDVTGVYLETAPRPMSRTTAARAIRLSVRSIRWASGCGGCINEPAADSTAVARYLLSDGCHRRWLPRQRR